MKHYLIIILLFYLWGCDNNDNEKSIDIKSPTPLSDNKNTISLTLEGVVIDAKILPGVTVCAVNEITESCDDNPNKTQTDANGFFSISVERSPRYLKAIKGSDDSIQHYILVIDENLSGKWVISPVSTLISLNSNQNYAQFKSRLGLASDLMIRTTNPFKDLESSDNKALIKLNTQLAILIKVLNSLEKADNEKDLISQFSYLIENTEINNMSFADSTLVKSLFTNLRFENNTQDQVVQNLSAVVSALLQKIWIDQAQQYIVLFNVIQSQIEPLITAIQNSTLDPSERTSIVFDTLSYLKDFIDRAYEAYEDIEAYLNITTYQIDHQDTDHFTIDGINAKTTEVIVYAREGNRIEFKPVTSSVFANHPFRISTEANDTLGVADIGLDEGWNQTKFTLTVTEDTPRVLYPHCGYHADMFLQSRIEVVDTFDSNKIDVNNSNKAFQIKGTVLTGPYMGASGFTYPVYLQQPEEPSHQHTFYEYPGLTFYMPEGQGYHGGKEQPTLEIFKTKSHFIEASDEDTADADTADEDTADEDASY